MTYVSFDSVPWNKDRTDDEWEQLAENLREASRENYRRKEESWQRSDTDGFLSQWAQDMTARGNRVGAQLADDKGFVEVDALFTVNGEIASTHNGWSDWGKYWVLNDFATEVYGKRFFNPSKAKNPETAYKNNRKKGFVLGRIKVRATVANLGEGYNINYAAVPLVSRLQDGDFEVITTDKFATDESAKKSAKKGNTLAQRWAQDDMAGTKVYDSVEEYQESRKE